MLSSVGLGCSWLPLNLLVSPLRNLEQEISFDFGPDGEFAYLYSQCYELTTNECVPHGQAGRVGLEGLGLSKDTGNKGGGLCSH